MSTHKPKQNTVPVDWREAGDLPTFSMQALVRQTGIAPDTLRAWERRYNFPEPARSAGGHRLYSMREVEAVRWVQQKQKEGLRAKQAIDLWKHAKHTAQTTHLSDAPAASAGDAVVALRDEWVRACLALAGDNATQTLNRASAMLGPENTLLDVVTAGLSQVGEQWAAGAASVSQEHFASALAMRHVQSLLNGEPPATRREKLLISCPDGEYHNYALVVLTYLLRRRGWPVIFLNASLPLSDLLRTVEQERPALVLACVQTVLSSGALLMEAEALMAAAVPFAFGGSVFVRYPTLVTRIPGAYLGAQLAEAPKMAQRILSGQVEMRVPAPLDREWLELSLNLPDVLLHVESEVLSAMDTKGMKREDAKAELELICEYLLSAARLGAVELLPNVWRWSEGMLRVRGLSSPVQNRFHSAVRLSLQAALGKQAPGLMSLVADSA